MSVSKNIKESIKKSSWIRKMFEEGSRLKAQFGDENVFDFSLGNPDLEPPQEFFDKLREVADSREKGVHGYMPNAGFPHVRNAIAEKVSRIHKTRIISDSIVLTCGAAGGLNTIFKTILDPGDEVIVLKPYFVEYGSYISNHNGIMKLVETASDFSIDLDNIKEALNKKTKAVLINSPNNPTGRIYTEEQIKQLSLLLEKQNNPVYLISDEPYREIVYDNTEVPSIFTHYNRAIVVTSFSKNLSIPGERLGYIAVNSTCPDIDLLMSGLILCNRILGFVNAPAFMQRVIGSLPETAVDVDAYRRRRDIFIEGLKSAGYDFIKPEGAFYIFCKSPVDDDVEFVKHLQKYNILVVPGVGFGGPGYFRICYCVPEKTIINSIPKFKEALESFKS